MKNKKYSWIVPALYVAYMFSNKIVEGFAHSEEFQQIISVIPMLKPYAYNLTPFVGLLDLIIGISLILSPFILKNNKIQSYLFIWTMIWPFVPASLRYFGGVAEFEIIEVLSISIASLLSLVLWNRFWLSLK